ncbi:MAG: SMP-30/gluconolactonase/LRE family protein [Myxococcota bacterium]|jgi:arylesterase/paraoxonase|nr:SMP-30/gluconolactonase/LRE family protein [Myxococcota bacterium]
MGSSRTWVSIYVGLLAVVAGFLFFRFAATAGVFKSIAMEVAAPCEVLEAPPGPEDIVIDRERGIAYVSATDRRAQADGEAALVNSGLHTIDLNRPVAQWTLEPVTPPDIESFRPHGLGLFVAEDGARSLFAVNHPAGGPDEVVIFDIDTRGRPSHRESVSDPLLHNLNDVQPVSANAFYATNDHGDAIGHTMQDFLLLDQANIVYYDGTAARVAAEDLTYANGVNISPDGRMLYVAETIDATLKLFFRDPETGDLNPADYVMLGTGLDNIDVLENGDLLIGAHPRLLDFVSHAGDPAVHSPSEVLHVQLKAGGGGKARTVYLNKGEQLSGIAVAAGYRDLMLLGPVFQPRILVCERPEIAAP